MTSVLKIGKDFTWSCDCQMYFDAVKQILIPAKVLAYFYLSKDIILAVDAFPYDIGAVFSHAT